MPLHWDVKSGKFKEEEANKFLSAKYNNGYMLPSIS